MLHIGLSFTKTYLGQSSVSMAKIRVDSIELFIIRSRKTEGDANISHPCTRRLVFYVYAEKNSRQHICPLKEKLSLRFEFLDARR